jgi:hypothetical protein
MDCSRRAVTSISAVGAADARALIVTLVVVVVVVVVVVAVFRYLNLLALTGAVALSDRLVRTAGRRLASNSTLHRLMALHVLLPPVTEAHGELATAHGHTTRMYRKADVRGIEIGGGECARTMHGLPLAEAKSCAFASPPPLAPCLALTCIRSGACVRWSPRGVQRVSRVRVEKWHLHLFLCWLVWHRLRCCGCPASPASGQSG